MHAALQHDNAPMHGLLQYRHNIPIHVAMVSGRGLHVRPLHSQTAMYPPPFPHVQLPRERAGGKKGRPSPPPHATLMSNSLARAQGARRGDIPPSPPPMSKLHQRGQAKEGRSNNRTTPPSPPRLRPPPPPQSPPCHPHAISPREGGGGGCGVPPQCKSLARGRGGGARRGA